MSALDQRGLRRPLFSPSARFWRTVSLGKIARSSGT